MFGLLHGLVIFPAILRFVGGAFRTTPSGAKPGVEGGAGGGGGGGEEPEEGYAPDGFGLHYGKEEEEEEEGKAEDDS